MTNLKENTPSVAQQNSEDTFKDKQQETLLKPEVLMSWTTKATPFPPKEIMKTQFGLLLGPIMLTALGAAIMWDRLPGAFFELIRNCSFAYGLYIYFIIFPLRQKTRFNYSITRDNGHIKYCVDYSTASKIFFKGIAIAAFIFFIGVAIYTQSLLFLIGPGAIALGAAKFLLGWENEIKQVESLPWSEYNVVTVDHKRLVIATQHTHETLGFEVRLPNKELFEQYLALLHRLLPVTAEFIEAHWEY
ncbi:hypothetical protein [Pseudomonas sp. NFPP19]|uniref:hypothetical protein n=1 Tax=Pseudomonas sp. NFPP19 TaxID=1566225 RepID=UPI0008CE8F2F|nr:hypothetical protein [Pseudomonas sp. NFPP19]SES17425.1 hypothetical protein SAMN03159354_05633 [Pseudomonas sp. NFPP19]